MNYKIGKYLAHTDEFEFVFDDGKFTTIDLVNDFPNYIHFNKSKINNNTDTIKNQTNYDKQCYNETPYCDNSKLYIQLYNLYNKKSKITIL